VRDYREQEQISDAVKLVSYQKSAIHHGGAEKGVRQGIGEGDKEGTEVFTKKNTGVDPIIIEEKKLNSRESMLMTERQDIPQLGGNFLKRWIKRSIKKVGRISRGGGWDKEDC